MPRSSTRAPRIRLRSQTLFRISPGCILRDSARDAEAGSCVAKWRSCQLAKGAARALSAVCPMKDSTIEARIHIPRPLVFFCLYVSTAKSKGLKVEVKGRTMQETKHLYILSHA